MDELENPVGFVIDGEVLEVPTLDTFDMDEAQILFDLSGVVIEDFIPAHPDASPEERAAVYAAQGAKIRNPAFGRAFVHIAYRRAHPDAGYDDIQALVGKSNAAKVTIAVILGGDSSEEDPSTSSPKPLVEKSSTNGTSEPSSSGSRSGSDSDEQDTLRLATGTGASDTSSPEWVMPTSESSSRAI